MNFKIWPRRERKSARQDKTRVGDTQRVIRKFFRLLERLHQASSVNSNADRPKRKEVQT